MKTVKNKQSIENKKGYLSDLKKPPIEMNYDELNLFLDYLLSHENFPSEIVYRSDKIHYKRRSMIFIAAKALYLLARAEIAYQRHIKKKIKEIKNSKEIYRALKQTGCLKAIRMYLYLARVGMNDLLNHMQGRFDEKLFSYFTLATQLYDASFDIPECRKYLKDFENFVLTGEIIESDDVLLGTFNTCAKYLKQTLSEKEFETFLGLIQIEHFSQLMSIYQLSDKNISQEGLRKITFSKGGIALLAIVYVMAPKMNEKQKKAIYELGSVLQIIDDIRDTKEDIDGGIQTLPNQKILTSNELKSMFAGTVNNLMEKCGMDSSKPNSTLDMLYWFSESLLEKRYGKFLERE